MQLPERDYSVVLFEADNSPGSELGQTQDYLRWGAKKKNKNAFFTSWGQFGFSGDRPQDLTNCSLDGEVYNNADDLTQVTLYTYGEFDSTELIEDAAKKAGGLPESIPKGMFLLEEETKAYLGKCFEKLFEPGDGWNMTPDDENKATILFLDRVTGSKPGGAYPELDSGTAITTLRDIAGKIEPNGKCVWKVISSGDANEASTTGIGEYWMKLKKIFDDMKTKDGTRRDIDAYFLHWASQENEKKQYFKMAVALRSGMLDLLTFLGIPTVSIGLRNMVGEYRHGLLAGDGFKRVHAQYDKPRHRTTAYVRDKKKPNRDPPIGSPYWDGDLPGGAFGTGGFTPRKPTPKEIKLNDEGMKAMRKEDHEKFSPFDEHVLTISVRRACEAYCKWPASIRNVEWAPWIKDAVNTVPFPSVITTSIARYCYLKEEEGKVKQALRRREDADRNAANRMKRQLTDPDKSIQLTERLFDKFYSRPHKKDWDYIRKKAPA
ncbi:hypothetical protein F4861DRAFT_543590 [Xylaria intraflava]|nr:hypothetical protein F4861DRAFT_543590 [Xylaria intraflava]